MIRALPAPQAMRRLWLAVPIGLVLGVYAALNLYFTSGLAWGPEKQLDWAQFLALPEAIATRNLYDPTLYPDMPWVWSPLLAPVMVGVTALGYWGWWP